MDLGYRMKIISCMKSCMTMRRKILKLRDFENMIRMMMQVKASLNLNMQLINI